MNSDKKRIIFGMPRSFSFYRVIIDRLEQLGYEVYDVSYHDENFKYKNLWDRFVNLLRKTFLNDKGYKSKLKFKSFGNSVVQKLDQIDGQVDYCLLIRADIYSKEIIEKMRSKSNKIIAYQWDGVGRYPAIKQIATLFDRFYVFDRTDIDSGKGNYLSTTNFYFGHLFQKHIIPKKNSYFFLGTFFKCRWEEIQTTANLIRENQGIPNFFLLIDDVDILKQYSCEGIQFIDTPINYVETLRLTLENQVIVDFLTNVHIGLSFRVFEAIGFERKLVTNNIDVKNYDFYHPNNIYILGDENRSLRDFINEPYFKLKDEILNQYNFDIWIKKLLEN